MNGEISMLIMTSNTDTQYSAAPVLSNDEAKEFITGGQKPAGCQFQEVPVGKLIRAGGFWFKPSIPSHSVARLFLISRDITMASLSELERPGALLYYSVRASTFYVGRIVERPNGGQVLTPILRDLHPDLPIQQLNFIGRVIAAI